MPEVGPWAREKLHALGAYLSFYTTALKNQGHWVKSLTFVDAFAGTGQARLRKTSRAAGMDSLLATVEPEPIDAGAEEYIRGSPLVALDIRNRFDKYIFIEQNAERAAELNLLQKAYPDCLIEVRAGNANDEIGSLLTGELGRPGHLAVVFLDPFGMQISWETIEGLAATRRIEVIVNFALGMAIQRVLPRSAVLRPGWRETLDRCFGSSAWFEEVFHEQTDLLGSLTKKRPDAGKRLLEWYRVRLKLAFGHVSPAKLIKNSRGGHLYYLIWAGPNRLGLKGAHYILSKGETIR